MSERIEKLRDAVAIMEGCRVEHGHSVPVREMFRDQVAWEGVVEVFNLKDHPKAKRCYAWSFKDEAGESRFVHVLEIPPVVSPSTAVRAYVASLGRK